MSAPFTLRPAGPADVAGMQRVRAAVRENRLVSRVLTADDYLRAIAPPGRGWVAEVAGTVRGFAVGDARSGNVWALFVDPGYERQGLGRSLFARLVAGLEDEGTERLWLTTEAGTRAERFYRRAGWSLVGRTEDGELRFEKARG